MNESKNIFDERERIGFEKLSMLNSIWQIAELGQTPKYYPVDASGYTKNGKTIVMENKDRTGYTLNYFEQQGTMFVEGHKWAELLVEANMEHSPLYCNYTKDGYAIVFQVDNFKDIHLKSKRVSVNSKGYEQQRNEGREFEYKFLLPMTGAWIYKLDNENKVATLIRKRMNK